MPEGYGPGMSTRVSTRHAEGVLTKVAHGSVARRGEVMYAARKR